MLRRIWYFTLYIIDINQGQYVNFLNSEPLATEGSTGLGGVAVSLINVPVHAGPNCSFVSLSSQDSQVTSTWDIYHKASEAHPHIS